MSLTKRIPINYNGEHCYDILLEQSYAALPAAIKSLSMEGKRFCIVSDSNVAKHYLDQVTSLLSKEGFCIHSFVFPAGEENKTLDVIEDLYEFLILKQFDRSDVLIALGGGVTGDMTGYAAATYLRGIRFIQLPTSLLSMVDSSIGGKTGVDFRGYKNMVGAFHQPALVYVNLSALKTLDARQIASGMGEIIKHGLIKDNNYYQMLSDHIHEMLSLDNAAVTDIVYRSELIKKQVVEADPKEKGERAFLNFGHTIGHAIEKSLNFSLLHGECVALGMAAASYISHLRGNLSKADIDSIEAVIAAYGLPVRFKDLDNGEIIANCAHDKKKDGAVIRFILLKSIGECYIATDVSKEEINTAINYLKGIE